MPLKIDTKGMELATRNIPNNLRRVMKRKLAQHAIVFQDDVTGDAIGQQLSGPWKRNPSKNRLASRSGDLRGSFRSKVTTPRSGLISELGLRCVIGGSQAPYARIHEFGGTIRPTRAKFLTIPMPDNLTGRGLTRFPSARLTPGAFILRKSRRLYVVRPSEDGGLDFMWLLKKEVRIPPRLNFRKRWASRRMRRDRILKINQGIETLLRQSGLRR